jgi:hypothetical protein
MLKAVGEQPSRGFVSGGTPEPVTGFDYPKDSPVMDEDDQTRQKLGKVLQVVCEWLYPKNCRQETILLRAHALIWFLRPDWLGNPTQVELGKRLGKSKASMGKVINQLRETFGFYVAGMRGEDARKKFARHAHKHAGNLARARREAFLRKARG